MAMKKLLLTGIAALFLATGTAHAKPAPPMTVTRIDGRSVDPLIAFLEASGTRSMVADSVMITAFNIHGVNSPPPPAKYDRPYPNVDIVYDLPREGEAWGHTEPPARPGGRCVIHLAPLGATFQEETGIEFLEPVGLPQLIRHEMGHCHGLIHDADGRPDEWHKVAAADRERLAVLTHRRWLEITGRRDVAPTTLTAVSPPTPQRNVAPSSTRTFSGGGY
jgi:hypothetical protein